MDETNSRLSRIHCLAPKLPFPLKPQPDEIFSSWLIRLALAHGCSPLSFTGSIWPEWRLWTNDTDRKISVDHVTFLANLVGIVPAEIEKTTLYPFAMKITCGNLNKGIWPWVVAVGARNLNRNHGIQFCPSCLNEDDKPYFRRQWRLAWHVVCERHCCLLLDKCKNCYSPLEPHRLSAEDKLICLCASCHQDLRDMKSDECNNEALKFQLESDNMLRCNQGIFIEKSVNASEWFILCKFFVGLIRQYQLRQPHGLKSFFASIGANVPAADFDQVGFPFELTATSFRHSIFPSVRRILTTKKEQFRLALRASEITRQCFKGDSQKIPDPLLDVYSLLPSTEYCRVKNTNSHSKNPPAPTSIKQVERMFRRLQQKI